MEIVTIILFAIAFTVVLANATVTYIVLKSTWIERPQKIFQCIFIWVLPAMGAGVAYAISREPKTNASGTYPTELSLGEDPYVGNDNGARDYFLGSDHGE